ncbi:MAG: AMP-binding enzyme [Bacillota bacterium]|uniref:AMP-binding enzyme n=1 Tax=Desulfurispora thermophila TaxID=265470 RepID=UPI00035E9A17|nr:hypothetical protein [Desulfurispora thermophila]
MTSNLPLSTHPLEATAQGQMLTRQLEEIFYQHAGVGEVVAIIVPNTGDHITLAAFIVPANNQITAQDLQLHLQNHAQDLPPEMKVLIEILDDIPKTPSGKCQKQRLLHTLQHRLQQEI